MIIQKWNYATKQYDPYEIPDDKKIVLFTEDMDLEINCTSCLYKTTFGVCYTSKKLHNYIGFGYPVCEECYNKEINEEYRNRER